jgi:hypothetical protein
MLKYGQKGAFDKRKTSVGSISTSDLFHFPSEMKNPMTLKGSMNMSKRLKRMMYSQKSSGGFKSGSQTTKNRSKVSVKKKQFQKVNPDKKKTLKNFRSSSNYKLKRVQSTRQPMKPKDDRNEAVPENEGSSFKNSKGSLLRTSPPQTKMQKSPLDLHERHLSIQIDLYPRSDFKQARRLESHRYSQNWRTETKDRFSSDRIHDLRRASAKDNSRDVKTQNYIKFEKANMNYTQQVEVQDPSLEQVLDTSDENGNDNVCRQLNFNPDQMLKVKQASFEENHHPNKLPLKSDRTNLERVRNKTHRIPLGTSTRAQIQNSAPQTKSNDDTFLDNVFSTDARNRKREESKERSVSNGDTTNRGGSNTSGKYVVKKIDQSIHGSLLSSHLLSSHVSLNYSASDSAGMDSKRHREGDSMERKNSQEPKVPAFTMEDELGYSGMTYTLSEDDEEQYPTSEFPLRDEETKTQNLIDYSREGKKEETK